MRFSLEKLDIIIIIAAIIAAATTTTPSFLGQPG